MRTMYSCGCVVFTDFPDSEPSEKCPEHGMAIWEQDDAPGDQDVFVTIPEPPPKAKKPPAKKSAPVKAKKAKK